MPQLNTGDAFPALTLKKVGGGLIDLPTDLAGSYGVVLVNRGAWCPYCTAQLAAFHRAADRLAAAGITVVSMSVDDEATATAMVDTHHLGFPVAHSADPDTITDALGAYTNDNPRHLQSTGFVLAPDGTVVTAVYSTGAIGRLVPDDVIGLVTYLNNQ